MLTLEQPVSAKWQSGGPQARLQLPDKGQQRNPCKWTIVVGMVGEPDDVVDDGQDVDDDGIDFWEPSCTFGINDR